MRNLEISKADKHDNICAKDCKGQLKINKICAGKNPNNSHKKQLKRKNDFVSKKVIGNAHLKLHRKTTEINQSLIGNSVKAIGLPAVIKV